MSCWGPGASRPGEADSGEAVRPAQDYLYIIERGPLPLATHAAADAEQPVISGRSLLAMAAGDFSAAETLAQSKTLLRAIINHYLGGQPLQSRRVLKELQEL